MSSQLLELTRQEIELEKRIQLAKARSGLLNFVHYTSPDGYEVSDHHRVMAIHLNLVAQGHLKRLMICIPPRHGKSRLVSVEFPAYIMGINPRAHILAASYNATLAQKMNRSVQRKIDSPLYRDVFPDTLLNGSNVRTTAQGSWLRNSDEFEIVKHGGFYRSGGVGGSATGYGATIGIIDDFCKNRAEANSQTYRDRVYDWYTSTFYTRLEKGGALVICCTRWHADELLGRLIDQAKNDPQADQWTVLNMPAIKEDPPNDLDERDVGEALWPTKYPVKKLGQIRAVIGERDWASLYQQRPAPAEGAIIKREWWKFFAAPPDKCDVVCISADLTFQDKAKSDFAVFLTVGRVKASYYVLGMTRARMEYVEQKRVLRVVKAKFPEAKYIFVENAANGPALISDMRRDIEGIIPITPKGSKISRLEAVSPLIEAGNVYLPDPKGPGNAWVNLLIEELAAFPSGANDDICDALSQALSELRKRRSVVGVRALNLPKERLFFEG